MTRIMLYNHSGCENRGCEAIVRSTAAMFAQAGASVALTPMIAHCIFMTWSGLCP